MQNTTPKKRGRPKGSTKLKPGDYDPATDRASKVSGTMYLFADGSHTWADSAINANTIEQFKRNAYITARFNQLINLIFQDDLIVEIDGSDGLPDEDVATKIRKMIAVPKVDFNYQARQCFTGFFWHGFYPYNCVYSEAPDEDGWWSLDELRDLPAKSFDCEPVPSNGLSVVLKSELYPGICLMSDGEIHYFQKDERYGRVSELKYVKHAKPPNDFTNDIAGMPMFYPTIPLLNRLNFAWKCQMQKCNRIGSPSIFIKCDQPIVVTDESGSPIPGKRNDYEYMNTILQNWGTNTSFGIPENMEIIELTAKESESAMETIHELAKLIVNQWSPTEQISTDGNAKLGGSQEAATTLLINFIVGFHRHISKVFTGIVQDILRYNNYKDYTVYLRFPKPEFRNSEIDIERAKVGFDTASLSANELRELLGYEPESEEDLKDIREWNVAVKQAAKVPKDLDGTILQESQQPAPEEETEEDTPEVKVPEDADTQEVAA